MHVAAINRTIPSCPGWDTSNMAMCTGDNEISGKITRAFAFSQCLSYPVSKLSCKNLFIRFERTFFMLDLILGLKKNKTFFIKQ